MLALYNSLLVPLRWAAEIAARRPGLSSCARRTWRERLARDLPPETPAGLWIHGASLGEATISVSLAKFLRRDSPSLPLALSASTDTGRERLELLRDVIAFVKPLDFPGLTRRVLDSLRPAGLVLIETELWPNLIHETYRSGLPAVVVNGRLSSERMSRYLRYGSLFRPVLGVLARVGAQSAADAERFVEAGLPDGRVEVTGNLKYDLPAPQVPPDRLRARFDLGDRPVVVAGSTRPGEDEPVVRAFLQARREHESLYLILAPRHPDRASEVRTLAERLGLDLHVLSSGSDGAAGAAEALLVDAVGELPALYGLGVASFVGGSLVPAGGHNVLEPASAGSPVLFGPHTGHVEEPADALLRAGGALRTPDADSLAKAWSRLLSDRDLRDRMGSAAERVVLANRGAMERTVELLRDSVPSARWEDRA